MHALLFALILALNAPKAGKVPERERAPAAEQANGAEQQIADQNIAFVLPEGWVVLTDSVKERGLIAALGNESRTKKVMVYNDQIGLDGPIGPKFEKQYEQALAAGGMGKREWGRFVEVAGFPAYERLGRANVGGKDTSVVIQVFNAGDKHYSMEGMLVEGEDASQDREIRQAMTSFRFLTPPVVSKSISGISRDSAAYRTGYFIGRTFMTLAAIVGVIIGIVAIAQQSGRKSKRHSHGHAADRSPTRPVTSRPPPLPGTAVAASTPGKIIPRGGVKPRQPPTGPSAPPTPLSPS